MVQKKCKKCGERKPATSEYFHVEKKIMMGCAELAKCARKRLERKGSKRDDT